jgi:hypothetical protein
LMLLRKMPLIREVDDIPSKKIIEIFICLMIKHVKFNNIMKRLEVLLPLLSN